MMCVAVSPSKAPASSASALISSFIFQRSSIESQLRSSTELWRRPIRAAAASPFSSSSSPLSAWVEANWAKLSIQWIFQWRSWMSMASSSSTASSTKPAEPVSKPSRYSKLRSISGRRRSRHQSRKLPA